MIFILCIPFLQADYSSQDHHFQKISNLSLLLHYSSPTPQLFRMKIVLFALAALAPFASAHFKLNYPAARGFVEDNLPQFPCGSFDTPSSNRTVWPVSDGSISLQMGYAGLLSPQSKNSHANQVTSADTLVPTSKS